MESTGDPAKYLEVCRPCSKALTYMRVVLRDCDVCEDRLYCSQICRDRDTKSHACLSTFNEAALIQPDCYMIRCLIWEPLTTEEVLRHLSGEETRKMLKDVGSNPSERLSQADKILSRLQLWNSDLAKRFMVKGLAFANAPLRLLYCLPNANNFVPNAGSESFIAVSYVWKSDDWCPANDFHWSRSLDRSIPLSEMMWNFILEMRESANEGIWMDQICIDQNNEEEKRCAISSMDTLFASARAIIIVIEDIKLTAEEVECLSTAFQRITRQRQFVLDLETSQKLFVIVSKIMSARWFSRAWCFHEWHMGNNRVFAIPCESAEVKGQDSVIGLVNFDDLVYRLPYFEKKDLRMQHADMVEKTTRFFHKKETAYSNIIANTLSYESRHLIDKLTIAINLCALPIAVRECNTTSDEACFDMMILALAAGDGTILTSRGEQIRLGDNGELVSWCQRPNQGSWGSRSELPEIHEIRHICGQTLTLDLLFLDASSLRTSSAESLEIAGTFLCSSSAKLLQSVYGLDNVQTRGITGSLACALDCGLPWMVRAWSRIQKEVAPEIDFKWERIRYLAQDVVVTLCKDSQNRKCDQTMSAVDAETVLRFTACILLFGEYWEIGTFLEFDNTGDFALCDLTLHDQAYRVPSPTEAKLWTVPGYSYYPRNSIQLAIPIALSGLNFPLSDRVMLLEQANDAGPNCWRVKTKACLFGSPMLRETKGLLSRRDSQKLVG